MCVHVCVYCVCVCVLCALCIVCVCTLRLRVVRHVYVASVCCASCVHGEQSCSMFKHT